MGVKRNYAFEHAQNAQIQTLRKVSSGHLLAIHSF